MKKKIYLIVSVILLALLPPNAMARQADSTRTLQMPVAEARQAATEFFVERGYSVSPSNTSQGGAILYADRKDSRIEIHLKPYSALATRISLLDKAHKGQVDMVMFWSAMEKAASGTRAIGGHAAAPAPIGVVDLAPAVVCLYSNQDSVDFQASGFLFDRRGLIITTAHKMVPGHNIKILFNNGERAEGRVLKIDKEMDLALVQATGGVDGPLVNLAAGRFYLENGEKVVSITCPQPLTPQFHNGKVDGPPRKAGGQLLWQVKLNVEPGTSGSPVFDSQARLVGVIKGRFRGTDSIGYIIPFETVLRFLEIY